MSSQNYNIGQASPRRVAILRALNLGDLLCFIPALRALKVASPNSSCTLIGLPWARSFARRFRNYFDDFIEFPGWPGLPERSLDYSRVPRFLEVLQNAQFDLALQCHGSGPHVNDIIALAHAKHSAGFHQPNNGSADLTTWIPYPDDEPEIWRWLRLACHLGGTFSGDHLEFPIEDEEHKDVESLLPHGVIERPYAVIHVGATTCGGRLWQPHNFALVAQYLYDSGYQIILTGVEEERKLVQKFEDDCLVPTINVCGQTSLGVVAALVRKAALVVCHDTGISHIAAALETPSIIVHNRSDKRGWPPLNRSRHRFVESFEPLKPATVIQEINDLLSSHPPRRRFSNLAETPLQSFPNVEEML
jgi:ADP-heptose:LPS heptosyltransferase